MENKTHLRIHPAIGMARVGNSDEYYLAPETLAAMPTDDPHIKGGLPIKKGTENTPIDSSDLRDSQHRLKKQAARFKIYQYQESEYTYPSQKSEEVTIGSVVDGKKVKDIVWTVHLANKKANCWVLDESLEGGIDSFGPDKAPDLRNKSFGKDANSIDRIKKLVIDAGPRAIKGSDTGKKYFKKKDDKNEIAIPNYANKEGNILDATNYPVLYPATNVGPKDGEPSQPITYLGEIETDDKGRLIVSGGKGLACRFKDDGSFCPVGLPPEGNNDDLGDDVNNDFWLDDTADGPVTAVIVFEDNSTQAIEIPAWVVSTDPSYAPQTPNAVSLWDDAFNTWIEDFGLMPEIFKNGSYQSDYQPDFRELVFPMFNAAHMQMWNTSLNDTAFRGHQQMVRLGKEKPYESFNIFRYIRKPQNLNGSLNEYQDVTKITKTMPLALGDARQSFLTVSQTQYFFLQQWQEGKCKNGKPFQLTDGEYLDKATLFNCLGGRFSPGIDMTFIIRDPHLYNSDWQNPAVGPFRMNAKTYDYGSIPEGAQAAVGRGYEPKKPYLVEPGDICKFMAIPWHTDYNSCATHTPFPNPNSPGGNLTENQLTASLNPAPNVELYWSWPAQRPVSVYTYKDLQNPIYNGQFFEDGVIPVVPQRFSLRGPGTKSDEVKAPENKDKPFDSPMMQVGRFQNRVNILMQWQDIGVIIQSAAIDGFKYDNKDLYLEVESNFEKDESNEVGKFPTEVLNAVSPPAPAPDIT